MQKELKAYKLFMDSITIFLFAFLFISSDSEGRCLVDAIQCISKRTKYMVVAEIKETIYFFDTYFDYEK